jgi:hypothetical protein
MIIFFFRKKIKKSHLPSSSGFGGVGGGPGDGDGVSVGASCGGVGDGPGDGDGVLPVPSCGYDMLMAANNTKTLIIKIVAIE